MAEVVVRPGWCCRWATCPSPVGCECVAVERVELCVPCAAAALGLPEGTQAGGVAAELLRRGDVA